MPGHDFGRLLARVRANFGESLFKLGALALSTGIAAGVSAGEFPVSGEHAVTRDRGKPAPKTIPFSAPKAGDYYFLRIYNGSGAESAVQAGSVAVNGSTVLSNRDFRKQAEFLEVPLSLQLQNSLEITLAGRPGSGFRVEVIGIDEVKPEIAAAISPDANGAGWHNSDVLVTFTCTDDLSGVASCTDPVTVSEEGAAQQVMGAAIDVAGNSAETQVAVSLDKTAPAIEATVSPSANSAGWHKGPATVSYQCEDLLSGVATCPDTVELAEEGAAQPITASATDIAGNFAESEVTLNIDMTPPSVQATLSAPPNSAGWHREPVTVSFSCSDALSGIESCTEDQRVAGDGPNQLIGGSATDLAGNTGSAEIIVSLDQTPPEISFVAPANGSLLRESQPDMKLVLSDNLALDGESLEVRLDGRPIESCDISGGQAICNLSAPVSDDAAITLTAIVKDMAGNTSAAEVTTALDSDGDTIADYADACPETGLSQIADGNGCAANQRDTDGDGINDAEEIAAGSDPGDENSFPAVSIETFIASPAVIGTPGERVELRWQVKGASVVSLAADDESEPVTALATEATFEVSPQITTRYTLTAEGPAGKTTRRVEVTLDVPAPPELWTAPTIPVQEHIATSLTVTDEGYAYVAGFDGSFYKVNPRGEVEWVLEDAGLVMGKAVVTGNRIIFGSNVTGRGLQGKDGMVVSLTGDKEVLWRFSTQGAVTASPLLHSDGSTVFVATHAGHVYALSVSGGEQLWHYELPGQVTLTAKPALSGERLVFHTENNLVFALDARKDVAGDRLLWHRKVD